MARPRCAVSSGNEPIRNVVSAVLNCSSQHCQRHPDGVAYIARWVERPLKIRRQVIERRKACRPSNGTTDVCPRCGTHSIEFNERYRLPNIVGPTPAWVCDSPVCGFVAAVRREDETPADAAKLRQTLKELRAKASRRLMKSRAVRERANRTLSKSAARKKRR